MSGLDPDVLAYYEQGKEAGRLFDTASGPLELERTRELILRELPDGPLEILDVGGGAGVHASWLASLGHRVHLVDPVPLHVEQATAAPGGGFTAEVGDARALRQADDSVDVVLLLGPLYHLQERDDRLAALMEASRVLRPGGLLFAAAISRFAALLDLLVRADRLHEPGVLEVVTSAVQTGRFDGTHSGLFTTAYFHLPDELSGELRQAGLDDVQVFNVEGPGFVAPDLAERWQDPPRRQAVLEAARLVESDPAMLAAASHLLAVGHRPG